MNRSDLIQRLANKFPQLTVPDTEMSIKAILATISDHLARGGRAEIRGFGAFSLSIRRLRTGRNPRTGEKVLVPEKPIPQFKPGKELRERVDYE